MIDPEHCQMFSAYNTWMNEKIYAASATLSDEERRRDRGAFFKSIHSTLNHLLWGDRLWLGRFNSRSYASGKIGVDLYEDFDQLRLARAEMDAEITDWAMKVTPQKLAGNVTWFSGIAQRDMTRPVWLCVSQMFNHQTHHRGQVTTLLVQAGLDPGITDLPWVPFERDNGGHIVLGEEYAL
ncbi:MAG TPA: DinB family protein [Burkholderiaceae bacterium]|nr:DinB family protein [Burkholderiaceae bacterium]